MEQKEGTATMEKFREFLATDKKTTVVPILDEVRRGHKFFGNQQEDVAEGFDLLLDKLGESAGNIFTSEWMVDLYCDKCNALVSKTNDKMCRISVEERFSPLYKDGLTIDNFMSGHISSLSGYKCPKCEAKEFVGVKSSRLMVAPEVLAVTFNKYLKKWPCNYPHIMDVKFGKRRELVRRYKLGAVIHHFGGQHGGHYMASCQRGDSVYMFNDSSVSNTNIVNSPNDYMLLYY
jgi:ubiquitin C-terminal hydrolase